MFPVFNDLVRDVARSKFPREKFPIKVTTDHILDVLFFSKCHSVSLGAGLHGFHAMPLDCFCIAMENHCMGPVPSCPTQMENVLAIIPVITAAEKNVSELGRECHWKTMAGVSFTHGGSLCKCVHLGQRHTRAKLCPLHATL